MEFKYTKVTEESSTLVRVSKEIKKELEKMKKHPRQIVNDIIVDLINFYNKNKK